MSIFHTAEATCAKCGHAFGIERCASVNADLRPDLRDAILDGSLQREACPKCATTLRLPPHMTYLDVGRGQWMMVEAPGAIERWQAIERDARRTWDRSFGARATPQGRVLGLSIRSRLVFGWTALREKILCAELGLDDVTLELLKLSTFSRTDKPPIADQTELRLVSADADVLRMDWLELGSERAIEGIEVPRADYDAVVAAPDDWAEARSRFDGVLLVDWRRLMFEDATA